MANPTEWTEQSTNSTAWTEQALIATAWFQSVVTFNLLTESSINICTESEEDILGTTYP